jgi:hypothetical protein
MSTVTDKMFKKAKDDRRWLFSQFQAACASLRKRSSYRRGPFLVDEGDLLLASSGTQREQTTIPEAEKMAERLESVTLFQSYEYNLAINNEAAALIRRLVAEKAKLVEAARPFAYLMKGDFYPTECEVERLRAAIEEVSHDLGRTDRGNGKGDL